MRISDWSSDVCSSDLRNYLREPSDIAKIITLRLLREAAHGHVVDQALAQRADRANLDKLVHRSTPQVKEPKGTACGSQRSIRRSEESRVGKEGVSTGRSRWSQ